MSNIEQRLEYLEEANELLRMQNRVLSTAIKGLIRGLPAENVHYVIESIQMAFEDELAALQYEEHPHADLFHDVTYTFFREKE